MLDNDQKAQFNGQIKAIFRGGKISRIDWGEAWEKAPIEKRLSYAEELASAMNQACAAMQDERNVLLDENAVFKRQLANADEAVAIQKQVVIDLVTNANAERQHTAKRIQELETRVKAQDTVIAGYERK